MDRRGAFDYILLETTGLADPGNIAPIFWVDDGLGSTIYLDGIVTVVDAKNILKSLDEPAAREKVGEDHDPGKGPVLSTAHLQISHADVIIVNKADLVRKEELDGVTIRMRSINGLADIKTTSHSRVPQLEGFVLDLHAYDQHTAIPDFHLKGHSHLDPTISTVTLDLPPFDPQNIHQLQSWLQSVMWKGLNESSDYEIHRLKGFVPCTDGSAKVIQGVREIFDIIDIDDKQFNPNREAKIVVIGRGLEHLPSYLSTK